MNSGKNCQVCLDRAASFPFPTFLSSFFNHVFHSTFFKYTYIHKYVHSYHSISLLSVEWFKGIDVKKTITNPKYNVHVNKYGVNCGGDLHMWESSGWITSIDPYGIFSFSFLNIYFPLALSLSLSLRIICIFSIFIVI